MVTGKNTRRISEILTSLIEKIMDSEISKEDCFIVRKHILDAVASAIWGSKSKAFQDFARLLPTRYEKNQFDGTLDVAMDPEALAMFWAFAIHASVYDDGSREGACHPGTIIIATAMALGTQESWDKIYKAIIVGYDVMVRLGRMGNPELTRRGFHPTSVVAPLGAAATTSVIMGLDRCEMEHALCIAALGGCGLMAGFKGEGTQPLQVAAAVRFGLQAANMAKKGNTGYPQIIEEGFVRAFLGNEIASPVEHPLEHKYAIKGCYLKPYAGCRHLHPSIDALSKIIEREDLEPDKISKITVRTYRVAVETEIHEVRSRYAAYFSIPYVLAARLIIGHNEWDSFDDNYLQNYKIVENMKKVRLYVDEDIDAGYPKQRGSIVRLHLDDGRVLSGKVEHALGEPENPLAVSGIIKKLRQGIIGSNCSTINISKIENLINEDEEESFDLLLGHVLQYLLRTCGGIE